MLWVNGYTSFFTSTLKLSPKGNRKYWAKNQNSAFFVLKDFNSLYINPVSGFLSSAKKRYREGYNYAQRNAGLLNSHILLSGNRLQIVAHSHGVAFAEGIAAFLYEEKRFVTELLVALQSCQAADTPQISKAIKCRIEFKTDGDFIVNRNQEKLNCANIEITETALKSGFVRYRIVQNLQINAIGAEYIFMRKKIPLLKRHMAARTRQFEIWTAINHALATYGRQPDNSYLFSKRHLQPEVLRQFAGNQN
ncbi:MAG: hypothetical protein ACXWEY_00535 [Bacteroidia bacterium]